MEATIDEVESEHHEKVSTPKCEKLDEFDYIPTSQVDKLLGQCEQQLEKVHKTVYSIYGYEEQLHQINSMPVSVIRPNHQHKTLSPIDGHWLCKPFYAVLLARFEAIGHAM